MGWIENLKQAVNGGPQGLGGMVGGIVTGAAKASNLPMFSFEPRSLNVKPHNPDGTPVTGDEAFFRGGQAPSTGFGSAGFNTTNAGRGVMDEPVNFPRIDPSQDSGMGGGPDQHQQAYQSLIDDLRAKIMQPYSYDGAGDKQVDSAFQGALDAITNARNSTNSNYATSKDTIQALTDSHVANIKGADRQEVQRNGSDLQSSYGANYDGLTKSLQDDRSKAMAEKTAMLQNLGIQDAGLGTTGDVQTQAIADNAGSKAAAMQQAQGYQAADLTRNTELGSNMANAGVDRQSDLRRQLDSIMGNLDNSEAGVQSNISQAKLAARQSDQANFQKQQGYYNDTLGTLLKDQADQSTSARDFNYKVAADQAAAQAKSSTAKGQGSNSVFDVVSANVSDKTGKDATPYIQAYSQALADNAGTLSTGIGDKNGYMASEIKKKLAAQGLEADPDMIARVVMGISNYGTDKLSAG